MDFKRNLTRLFVALFVIVLYGSSAMMLSGCETLRKKFVRQKKKDREGQELIPIFEPVDYAAQTISPEERYKHFYSMWKIWNGDLVKTIDEEDPDTLIQYNVDQSIVQLTEMRKWLNDEKKVELDKTIKVLQSVQKDMESPAVMRNQFQMKMKVERNAKVIRNVFNPQAVKDILVSP